MTQSRHLPAGDAADGASRVANLIPNVARALLGLVEERGQSPERLCRGLGFTYRDLLLHQVLLSHQQTRELILRAQRLMQEPAIGLAVGGRETPVSWGVAGLAMLTCETLGEAMNYSIAHQSEAGALVDHRMELLGNEVRLEVIPRRFDLQIEDFLIDEALAGAVSIARYLAGPEFRPLRIDLARPRPAHEEVYRRYFRCPVRFDAGVNLMVVELHWLGVRLPGYDRITCGLVRAQLNTLLHTPVGRDDLLESVANQMRFGSENEPTQQKVAKTVNVSTRSLRRLLSKQGTTYRELRDSTRYRAARDLLVNSDLTIAQIAERVGYADARSFRRAFKRWSGLLPVEYRARALLGE